MIIPTDEEAVIARAVRAQLGRPHDPGA
jgi:hypothetical protein